MKAHPLHAGLAIFALAISLSAQTAEQQAKALAPGHGVAGRLVPNSEQWLVDFDKRSFDLSRLRAAIRSNADVARVDEIVASYRQATERDQAAFVEAIEKLGGRVFEQFWIINCAAIEIPFDKVAAVRRLPGVARVSPNRLTWATIKKATNADNHNSDAVNALGVKGKGIATAIMDTGLDSNCGSKNRPHRTFYEDGDLTKRNRLLANVKVGLMPADNANPHGTGVAGIAAGGTWGNKAADHGHAPHADIVGYSIANNVNSNSNEATMVKAWQQILADVAKFKIKTANNSYSGFPDPLRPLNRAMDACALTGDVLICISAGNSGASTGSSQSTANGLAVAAVHANNHAVAAFSSKGPLAGDPKRFYPDIAACGVVTEMPQNDAENATYIDSGTSMAAPQVCGTATLLRSAVPALSAAETKVILLASTKDLTTKNPKLDRNAYGMGLLSADRALALARAKGRWGRASVDSTKKTWQQVFSVKNGRIYRAAATWMRQVMTSKNWSDLNVEILRGSTVLATAATPRNLYEVAQFKSTFDGSVIVRVTGKFIEKNKQDFAWTFTEGIAPPIGPATYTAFGAGCPGASQGCKVQTSRNWTQSLASKSSKAVEIALSETGTSHTRVCKVEFWMGAKVASTSVNVRVRESGTNGPGKILGSAQMTVGTKVGSYAATFSPGVLIPPSHGYFITIDNIAKLNLPVSKTGQTRLHYERVGTTWTLQFDTAWQYRVSSDNGFRKPVLTNTGLPILGKSMRLNLSTARPNAVGVLVLGLSDKTWGAFKLPLAFAPPCSLLVSGDSMTGLVTKADGKASVPLPLPNSRALLRLSFFNQFLIADPVNAIGLSASNAGRGTIGEF